MNTLERYLNSLQKRSDQITKSDMGMQLVRGIAIGVILVLIIMWATGCASMGFKNPIDFTPREWTTGEKIMAGAFIAAHGANWYSTKRALSFDNITEMNPILGERPNDTEIASYFIVSGLIGLGVAHYMPEWRYWILGGYAATNIYFTFHDMQLTENMKACGIN